MSLEVYFLHSIVDVFPENLGAASEDQGEKILTELHYHGPCNIHILADYC